MPKSVVEFLQISKESVDTMKEELAALRAERDALKLSLATSQNHFDWLRLRVNTLEVERAQLIEKAYGLKLPVPEIVRTTNPLPEFGSSIFEDMGEEAAKALGLPLYGGNN